MQGPWEIVVLATFSWAFFGNGGALALNTYFDRDANRGYIRGVYPKVEVNRRLLLPFSLLVITLGLIFSFFINETFVVLYATGVILAVFYSVPPVRLKSRPGLDMLTNAFGYGGLTFLAGWVVFGAISREGLFLALAVSFAFGALYVVSTLWHPEEDKKASAKTMGVVLGSKKSLAVAMVLGILTILFISYPLYTGYLKPMTYFFMLPAVYILIDLFRRYRSVKNNDPFTNGRDLIVALFLCYILIITGEVLG